MRARGLARHGRGSRETRGRAWDRAGESEEGGRGLSSTRSFLFRVSAIRRARLRAGRERRAGERAFVVFRDENPSIRDRSGARLLGRRARAGGPHRSGAFLGVRESGEARCSPSSRMTRTTTTLSRRPRSRGVPRWADAGRPKRRAWSCPRWTREGDRGGGRDGPRTASRGDGLRARGVGAVHVHRGRARSVAAAVAAAARREAAQEERGRILHSRSVPAPRPARRHPRTHKKRKTAFSAR